MGASDGVRTGSRVPNALRRLASVGLVLAIGLTGTAARADEPEPEVGAVPVHVTVAESFSLRGQGALSSARASCKTPCTLQLVPGEYKYFSARRSGDVVAFTGPSRLDLYGPAEPLHTVGLVVGGIGVLGVVGPLIALFSTCSDRTVDALGQPSSRRCVSFGEGPDRSLAIVAGGGFALAVIGGLLFFATSGGLTVTDVDPRSAPAAVSNRSFMGEVGRGIARGGVFTF